MNNEVAYNKIESNAKYSPWLLDREFSNVYNLINKYTLIDEYRLYELYSLLRQCSKIDGDIIEIGVWRGGSAGLLGRCRDLNCPDKDLILCDTFSGVVKASSHDSYYTGGEHADTDILTVKSVLNIVGTQNVNLLVGIFPEETAGYLPEKQKFSFAHIDVDVYESAKDSFDYIFPRLTAGGFIVFDDYGFSTCDGVTKFCNELSLRDDIIFIYNLNGHAVLIKR